jgi:hypothetical protein
VASIESVALCSKDVICQRKAVAMRTLVTPLGVVCVAVLAMGLILPRRGSSAIDPDSVVGVWLLDEGKGEAAEDSSGNGNDGLFVETPVWVEGKSGNALEFDGNDFVDCGDIDAIDGAGSLTAMAWVMQDGTLTSAQGIVRKQDLSKGDNGPLALGGGWSAHKATMWVNSGGWANAGASTTDIDDGDWHHVAGSFDGTTLRIYVDGVEENDNPSGGAELSSTPEHLALGAEAMGREFWKGVIDEAAVFTAALGENDINAIMNNGLEQIVLAVSPVGKLTATWGRIKGE